MYAVNRTADKHRSEEPQIIGNRRLHGLRRLNLSKKHDFESLQYRLRTLSNVGSPK
jgi:hypothetical protein